MFSQKEHYLIKEDRLYWQGMEGERLVVPVPMRERVLQLGHSVPLAGHLGQQKTLARIASRFHWPRLYMDVVDFCKSCPECQLTSPSKRGDRAPLVRLPIIDVHLLALPWISWGLWKAVGQGIVTFWWLQIKLLDIRKHSHSEILKLDRLLMPLFSFFHG